MAQSELISQLAWLPELKAPIDWKQLKDPGELREAAAHRLDWITLPRLAKACDALSNSGREFESGVVEPTSIWVVSNATMEFLAPAIKGTGPRYGFLPQVYVGEFGQIVQPFLADQLPKGAKPPDVVLIYVDLLPMLAELDPSESGEQISDHLLSQVSNAATLVREKFGAEVFVTTTPPPLENLFGSLDSAVPGTAHATITEFNQTLHARSMPGAPIPIDLARIAGAVGVADWRQSKLWHKAKLAFSPELGPLVADVIMRTIAAARGRSRRCLVLDLDNTIWGGLVGDDGYENLHIGPDTPVGEAFLSIQRYAKQLFQRGIVLAVCSKNDLANALAPFENRTDMALSQNEIAVFKANWNDKANNILAITQELNLGLGSIVFADDNPVERAQVRQALPEVAVPELSDDPADYVFLLSAAGYFESLNYSAEDRDRGQYYTANAKRNELAKSFDSLDDFLGTLNMELSASAIDCDSLARAVDLFNKTNQFNLNGTRFSRANLEEMKTKSDVWTLQASLRDSFGDNGIITALVIEKRSDVWLLSNWVMSCRVFGRRIEEGILDLIIGNARKEGVRAIRGEYQPLPRNQYVSDLFPRLGFDRISLDESGAETWELELANYRSAVLPLTTVDGLVSK